MSFILQNFKSFESLLMTLICLMNHTLVMLNTNLKSAALLQMLPIIIILCPCNWAHSVGP